MIEITRTVKRMFVHRGRINVEVSKKELGIER